MNLLRHGVGLIGCGGRPADYSTGKPSHQIGLATLARAGPSRQQGESK
jgi:hypothetical protein